MTMFGSCPELLTVRDAARWIADQTGIRPSVKTIHRWMLKGARGRILRSQRIGGLWYISPSDLASFVKGDGTRAPVAQGAHGPVHQAARRSPIRRRQIAEARAEAERQVRRGR